MQKLSSWRRLAATSLFNLPDLCEVRSTEDTMSVPEWIQDAIFYQIFPDRFANGDPANDPVNVQPWGSAPTFKNFQGGDLLGVVQKLDYLVDLGVNAIYFNPIFLAHSNHRYDTVDYLKIDHRLGEEKAFQTLLKAAHAAGIKVILDGVFNHCGRGFFGFVDLLENQEHSAYRDWFHVRQFPLDAYSPGKAETYLGWWGLKSLPKFNTDNRLVREYLLNVAQHWVREGIDGWRLDVPNEIDDDAFWAEFRDVVKIWTTDPRWVGNNHFDGLMNYPLREVILDFLNGEMLSATGFADRVESLLQIYPRENVYAMYLTLGSHDTERIFTILGDHLDKVKLALGFLFAYPGAPAVYYGDEIGLEGGKDPECRTAFPWDRSEWYEELHAWVKSLVSLRKNLPVMRRGDYRRLLADDRHRCYAFARILEGETIVVVLNASPASRWLQLNTSDLDWQDGQMLRNLLGLETYQVEEQTVNLNLSAWSTIWLAGT
jgi:cyclomaltodextrinase / maltogenic alpha-amylase / neopullulanase